MMKAARWMIPVAIGPYFALAWAQSPAQPVDYETDIRPVLKAKCISCHSSAKASGGLDLSSEQGLQKGGISGPLFSTQNPDESLLLKRLHGKSGLPVMPLGFAPLPAKEIALFRQWITEGGRFAASPSFKDSVQPILKAYCVSCHGASNPAAGLDLTSSATLLKSHVVKPGNAKDSELIRRILGQGGKPRMPMGFAPLSKAQVSAITKWIDAGAPVSDSTSIHWAYVAAKRPSVPNLGSTWVRNPIDAFVLEQLKALKLEPRGQADAETLLRRVSLDLTGLPPTLAEMNAFLADKSPRAYENVVDRLLASKHYGERQARPWLDLARYADTHGYEADRSRQAWVYRDWVIRAFNENMPFDQFTTEQLAGDLLPKPSQDQLIATGFHRNSMFNEEGGVDPKESMYETILDRVNTTSTVWLGSTLACSRCHDHKFDPFTAKDYFQMYAFFNQNEYRVEGDANVGQQRFFEPAIPIALPEQLAKISALEKERNKTQAEIALLLKDSDKFEQWKKRITNDVFLPVPVKASAASGTEFDRQADGSLKVRGPAAAQDEYSLQIELGSGSWTGLRLEVIPDPDLPNRSSGWASSGNFILSQLAVSVENKPITVDPEADFIQNGYQLRDLFDNNGETGWALAPRQHQLHELVLAFSEPVNGPTKVNVKLKMNSAQWVEHLIGRFRISATQASSPAQYAVGELRETLKQGGATQEVMLRAVFEKVAPDSRNLTKRLAVLNADLVTLKSEMPSAMVMRDRPNSGKLTAPVHTRGEFLSPGKVVSASPPHFLPKPSPSLPMNRYGLARWIVSPQNPLTARVTVNRMWAQYFGHGLVTTEDDFGTQGEKPTHPKLLDWLATEFVAKGWNLKHIHKLIVMSATYRQSSNATADLVKRDPANKWYARGPRFRMEAEMIRDTALSASGLLNPKIGGPSVMPFQPDGVWDSPYSGERWMKATDDSRFRRGLYVFWKRTAPYPSFMTLDAPSRETCTVSRTRTNTPLQALALLNDPAYVEAALGLAKRLSIKKEDSAKANLAFRLATNRTPRKDELARIVKLAETTRNHYKKRPAEAAKLAGDIELATWTMVANVLLNLDETVTKG